MFINDLTRYMCSEGYGVRAGIDYSTLLGENNIDRPDKERNTR